MPRTHPASRRAARRPAVARRRGSSRQPYSGWSHRCLVDEAPPPVLPRLERPDDPMADQAGVPAGVLARGLVATADVPAGQAQPQMDPGGPDPQALLAALRGPREDILAHEGEVRVEPYRNGHRSSVPFDCSAWSS